MSKVAEIGSLPYEAAPSYGSLSLKGKLAKALKDRGVGAPVIITLQVTLTSTSEYLESSGEPAKEVNIGFEVSNLTIRDDPNKSVQALLYDELSDDRT